MYSANWTVSPASPVTNISNLLLSLNILSWSEEGIERYLELGLVLFYFPNHYKLSGTLLYGHPLNIDIPLLWTDLFAPTKIHYILSCDDLLNTDSR